VYDCLASGATPSSSPDPASIEAMFSEAREALRSTAAKTTDAILEGIGPALRAISPQGSLGWFQSRAACAIRT
jgi:hypothetical protein